MFGVTSIPGDAPFDSYLLRKTGGSENHTLTLALKIHLKQVSTYGLKKLVHLDFDKHAFVINPWRGTDWAVFKQTFLKECARWNNNFWLVPPRGFSKLDVKTASRVVRPNIYCHLYVALTGSVAGAHREIEVANLDKQFAKSHYVRPGEKLNSGTFRSDDADYDSLDITPRNNFSQDGSGAWVQHANYLTIVHEIGHAIGQPHSGVLHKDILCSAAILSGDGPTLEGTPIGALFKGKSNSQACYGTFAPLTTSDNVMGSGTQFDETNAQPWLDRIAVHTQTKASDWTVKRSHVPPSVV